MTHFSQAHALDEEVLGKAYDQRLLARLWSFVAPHRWLLIGSVVLIPIALFFELFQPHLLQKAIDGPIREGDFRGLSVLAGIYLLLLFGDFGFNYLRIYLLQYTGQKVLYNLRLSLFSHLQHLSLSYFHKNPLGKIITRLTNDMEALNEMFSMGLVAFVSDIIKLVVIIIILLVKDLQLALVTFTIIPVIAVLIMYFRRKLRDAYRQIRKRLADINIYLQECISGMDIVQLFTRESRNASAFKLLNERFRDANFMSIRYDAALFSLVELMGSVAVALIIWYGGGQVVQERIELGLLVAFVEYIQRFFIPLRDISAKYTVMQGAMAASERIFSLLDTEESIDDPVHPVSLGRAEGRVEFDRVWFSYNDQDSTLKDISMTVRPGEKIGLVGLTGAGKSTLVKLITRLYDVQQGAISIDGVDIRNVSKKELRRMVGVVDQDVHLFSGTIGENIRFGNPASSPREVQEAIRQIGADTFIQNLPGAYDEPILEAGQNLSVGQKQLISFARAMVYQPKILILDEATSNIDPETEKILQKAIWRLMEGKTSFVIAHRIATLKEMDRIVVIHKGRIREEGTHEDLLRQDGIYARLYRLQFKNDFPWKAGKGVLS